MHIVLQQLFPPILSWSFELEGPWHCPTSIICICMPWCDETTMFAPATVGANITESAAKIAKSL